MLNNIVKLCKEKGISIRKLEQECGLGNATIRKWDKSSPIVANVQKVADYFGVPVCELLEGEDEET